MALRRSIGNRAFPEPHVPPTHRGPERLWPHACFDCRKSWKLGEAAGAKCPDCAGALHWMGRAFKPPRKTDSRQWAKVRALWMAGFRFVSHTRWLEIEPFPEHPRDVEEFVRRNPTHPFRIAR
jgi:hypothetical protein